MRTFGAIMCFALLAVAAAQPGYRYQNPQQTAAPATAPVQQQPIRQNVVSYAPRPQAQAPVQSNSGIYSVVPSQPLAQFNVQGGAVQQQHQQQQQTYVAPQPAPLPVQLPLPAPAPVQLPQQSYLPPQQQQQTFVQPQIVQQTVTNFQQQLPLQQQQVYQPAPQRQTIVTKDIYIHSAPEENEEIGLGQQFDNAPLRKNYRIVFIKAPSPNLRLATSALKRAQATNEEKTVIYVLSKKPDLADVQQQLQQVQGEQKTHKPEVYFIKYKTQEEAQRAQQEIQAQYDALGGSTHISDEGIAPVQSVIGSVGQGLNFRNAANLATSASNSHGSFVQTQQNNFQQAASTNFQQSASTNYQQSASSNSFVGVPANKYLPVKAKK